MSYRKTAHSVYSLKVHLVWITKYRKPVLRGEIAKRLRELVRQTCATLDVIIESGHVAADHVHLLVSVPPDLAVSELMQRIKGRSSRLLLVEFGELNRQFWGKHLWARGYFAASSGNVTDEIIKQYIESQAENLPPPDEGTTFSVGD
jgi:putative transposase